jgi:hypothetical protein
MACSLSFPPADCSLQKKPVSQRLPVSISSSNGEFANLLHRQRPCQASLFRAASAIMETEETVPEPEERFVLKGYLLVSSWKRSRHGLERK